MQKLEAAVILMQKIFKEVEFLFPREFNLDEFVKFKSDEPFSDEAIDFLDAMSKILLKDKRAKSYPDVATFAFFCRRANIVKLKEKHTNNNGLRLGRGIVFHIAPSNVPVNFAYSLICGMLAGNTNIVRVPSKLFEQVEIIINAIIKLSQESEYKIFAHRFALARYDRQNRITNYFSSVCDVRVIWGGDRTIADIRKNELAARAYDITFADRYSICVINANAYVNEEKPDKIARAFYNDTFLFDQNACTAPHLVIWLGDNENVTRSKNIFWSELYELVKAEYKVQPVIAVDKLTALYNQAINSDHIRKESAIDNLIWRIELENLNQDIDEYRCSSGYFCEYHASSLSELTNIVNRKYQTLAHYGFDLGELVNFIKREKPSGIDRIVPIGNTMDFSFIWDGYNIIEALSRKIEVI
jgi:hypothetical protein